MNEDGKREFANSFTRTTLFLRSLDVLDMPELRDLCEPNFIQCDRELTTFMDALWHSRLLQHAGRYNDQYSDEEEDAECEFSYFVTGRPMHASPTKQLYAGEWNYLRTTRACTKHGLEGRKCPVLARGREHEEGWWQSVTATRNKCPLDCEGCGGCVTIIDTQHDESSAAQ